MKDFDEMKNTMTNKWNSFRFKVRTNTKMAAQWVAENPDKAIGIFTFGGMVVGAGVKCYKNVSKAVESHRADRTMYCGTVNRRVRLKHSLSDREIKELATLMQAGLTRYEALEYMELIK